MDKPRNSAEVIAILREIAELNPSDASDQAEAQSRCTALATWLTSASSNVGDVPHFVWHFLHDSDIRAKDPEYSKLQRGTLLEVLNNWAQSVGA